MAHPTLMEQFSRLQWLLHRHHFHNHKSHSPQRDPYRGQGRVLLLLKMHPEISQKELSFLLDMRPQSLGELLAKLERGGYITRTPSESDKRILDIKLTEKGLEAAQEMPRPPDSDPLFSCLSPEEQAHLADYLSRLIEQLEPLCDEGPHKGRGGPHSGFGGGWGRGGAPRWPK